MTQLQMFGGDWTEEKLLRIKKIPECLHDNIK